MNAIIIEDHKSHALDVEMILIDFGITNITKSFDLDDALIQINNTPPDIAVVDLFLNDKACFDLIPLLKSLDAYVIILTGFPSMVNMEKSIGLNVDGFLSKPVQEDELKFQFLNAQANKKISQKNHHFFNYENKILRVDYNEILYLEAEGNYTTIFLKSRKIVLKKSMKSLLLELNHKDILQVSRNTSLHKNQIIMVNFSDANIQTNFGKEFSLGRTFKKEVKTQFNLIN